MQNSLKKIYISLAALSVLIAAAVTLWIYHSSYPYVLHEETRFTSKLGGRIDIYKDLDNDGCSERVVFFNDAIKKYHNLKIYRQPSPYKASIIDQYNFYHPIKLSEIFYHDITGDGMKEVFVFSHDDQALYLSIIDPGENVFIYKERPVLPAPRPLLFTFWDVEIIDAVFADVNADGHKEIIFTVHSGHSHSPRGVFILDIQQRKIIRRFPFKAGSARIIQFDLTGDGVKEFIVSTTATNNLPRQEPYSDDKSWLMVFNRQLRFLFKPLAIAGRFSSVLALPFRYQGQNMILANVANKNTTKLLLINKTGQIIKEQDTGVYFEKVIRNSALPGGVYLVRGPLREKFQFLDSTFTINTVTVSTQNRLNQLIDFTDLNRDGRPEFLGYNKNGLYIKTESLKNLACFPWKQKFVNSTSLYFSGPHVLPYISVNTTDLGYLFQLKPNPYYSYLPLLFLLTALCLFAVFYLLHLGFNRIRIYTSYLLFSLRGSDNAIILLNHKGNILTFNAKVNQILRLSSPLNIKQHYTHSLGERRQIVKMITEAIRQGRQVKEEFSFEEAQNSFIGELTVTPFHSYFKFINAFLIEIKDSTRQVLFERQQNWQRNVRKMVHDIKNPLAGVQLKMQTLYFKLIETLPDVSEEIKEEFEYAYSELKRIRNISKDFLKFSDLDHLQIEEIPLQQICNQCIEHFYNFRNEYLSIHTEYANNLPQKVFWDERQIELLIHIIVENAIDALKGHGEIRLTLNPSAKVLNTDQPYIELRISDNGPGIPDKFKDKIFEPHFSTKQEGTGMGLVFAKHIVQQHGGTIEFFSTENSGTVFVITLPQKAGST